MKIIHQYNSVQRYQSGFTLVELMIAAFISLAVVGGILSFASSNKSSYTMQSEMGRLQENARFALETLSRNIGSAGFTTKISVPPSCGILAFGPQAICGPGDIASPLPINNNDANTSLAGLTTANGTASDQITINMESVAGAQEDCLGQAVAIGSQITNRYFIADTDSNGLYDLYCQGNGGNAPQTLVEGVDNMQILYGEDTDAKDLVTDEFDDTVNVYIPATQVTDWERVLSVRIALLMSTVIPLRTGQVETETYQLLDAPTMGPFNNGENRIRRVFTKTILIRSNISG